MEVIEVDPKRCIRWKFADRSGFEFGDIFALAEDIKKNGQIEPAILRKSRNPKAQFEVIAGSRRWKACLEAEIPLQGIVQDLSDAQAAIAQIKENQHLSICDYSKGVYYAKLLKEKKLTLDQLAESIKCSKPKLQNFLAFEKVPPAIWKAVGNLSKVSSRTAGAIYALSQKGDAYAAALIDLAEDIRKGAGCSTLERKVFQAVNRVSSPLLSHKDIVLPCGTLLAQWTKNGIQFAKDIPLNEPKIESLLIKHFEEVLPSNRGGGGRKL